MKRDILIVGVNHRSAPVEVRERLAVTQDALEPHLQRLTDGAGVEEVVLLSTCNRVEVIVATESPERARQTVHEFLRQVNPEGGSDLQKHLHSQQGRDAVRHLFRIAASLDSMVVGEPQILGQIKEAYAQASRCGATGTILHRCFHRAFRGAKRVRSETGIASHAVSVSSAAVELAGKIFDQLTDKTVLLIGAGTMSELALRHLAAAGARHLFVCNRTLAHAEELANQFLGVPVPFPELDRYVERADVILGSTAAHDFVLTREVVAQALRRRKYRPMFLIDLSVPRNFDPQINELDNVYLYDIDDLSLVTQENLELRTREAQKAETIIEAEVEAFLHWLASLDAVPSIVALRERAEQIRRSELERTLPNLSSLQEEDQKALVAMTESIVNKILHAPVTRLKADTARRETANLAAFRQLFGLEEPEES